jgi:1-acyl-sn-glycerol-3-phosphate acyltransferase
MSVMKRGFLARTILNSILWYYKKQGWTEVNANPDLRKCVIIAAPHTSNWDFVYYIGAIETLGLNVRFAGKKSLFRWPFGKPMVELGGVPVDRSKSNNFVDAMVEQFNTNDDFMLTIAPEGTRGKVKKWKTGFYHIAVQAGVPLVIGMMDYEKKQVGLTGAIWPTGDYAKDMEKVLAFYSNVTPRNPHDGTVDFNLDG